MVLYKCDRCGYSTIKTHSFKYHLNRKYPCKIKYENKSLESIKIKYGFIDKPFIETITIPEKKNEIILKDTLEDLNIDTTSINEIIPYYVQDVIKSGVYENIGYDVNTVAVNGQLITSSDQPVDLIYGITKALWNKNTRKLLDKGHPKGKVIRPETALKGVLIPLHPGAEKFYKEAGLLK